MPNEERLTPAERELEMALGALQPAGARLDRDYLVYRAGLSAGRRGTHLWQAAAAVLVACVGVAVAVRPAPRTVEIVRYVPQAQPAQPWAPAWQSPAERQADEERAQAMNAYLRLRDEVLAKGLSALPNPPARRSAGEGEDDGLRPFRAGPGGGMRFFGVTDLIPEGEQL